MKNVSNEHISSVFFLYFCTENKKHEKWMTMNALATWNIEFNFNFEFHSHSFMHANRVALFVPFATNSSFGSLFVLHSMFAAVYCLCWLTYYIRISVEHFSLPSGWNAKQANLEHLIFVSIFWWIAIES